MCAVVDPPVFVSVFKSTDAHHEVFRHVLTWVERGNGKLVMGGTQFRQELTAVRSVLRPLAELERRNKIVRCNEEVVDAQVAIVRGLEKSKAFDDPHLVALVRLTGCRVICTKDEASHQFLRSAALYERPVTRPRDRKSVV